MKKEGKIFVLFFVIGIILILSVNFISASLLSDIGDIFKKVLRSTNNNIKGEVEELSSISGTDYEVKSCIPDCIDKYCGTDRCEGNCGICDINQACIQGNCVPAKCEYADMNGDSKLDGLDIQEILSTGIVMGAKCNIPNNYCRSSFGISFDFNGDGSLDGYDIQYIQSLNFPADCNNNIDVTPPEVNLKYPIDGAITISQNNGFYVSLSDDVQLKNTTLYVWDSTNNIIHKIPFQISGTILNTGLYGKLPYFGTFKWNYYVCDTSSNCAWNKTNWSVTYDSPSADTIYPQFSDYWDNSGTLTGSGTALFNVTVENTNGTVFLDINGRNYTAKNLTRNRYNVTVTLSSSGTYDYYWSSFGNGTSHLFNISPVMSYTVNSQENDNLEMSLATLKDTYVINEEIKLTDPPDKESESFPPIVHYPKEIEDFLDSQKKNLSDLNEELSEEIKILEKIKTDYEKLKIETWDIINLVSYIKKIMLKNKLDKQKILIENTRTILQDSMKKYKHLELNVFGGEDLYSTPNTPVYFYVQAYSTDNVILNYKWDFDGDMSWDYESSFPYAKNTFLKEGKYTVFVMAVDAMGISDIDEVIVNVNDDYISKGTKNRINNIDSYTNLKPIIHKSADGETKYYAIIINGGFENRFWNVVVQMYSTLKEKYGFNDNNIYLLNTDGINPDGLSSEIIIDYPARKSYVENIFIQLANMMDEDDILFLLVYDHGSGYYGLNNPYYGCLGGFATVEPLGTDEQDYLEKDFNLRTFYTSYTRRNYGMDSWQIVKQDYTDKTLYYRIKYVSTINNLQLDDGRTVNDNDVFIELLKDYLLGDTNKNGYIEPNLGEVFDYDNDGVQPHVLSTNIFDEDDWGKINEVQDNKNSLDTRIPGPNNFCIFDQNLDNKLDIDIDCECPVTLPPLSNCDPSSLHVDGTDINNQGLIEGIDVNSDGDMEDWISIDETFSLVGDVLKDDELRDYLDMFDIKNMIILMEPCFSGGFVDDLSKESRVIITSTTEEWFSYNNIFSEHLRESFDIVNIADVNFDGKVSMVEAFNYVSENDYLETPQYDDNGDFISHSYPIPQLEDGALGDNLFLPDFDRPQSKLVNKASSILNGNLKIILQKKSGEIWIDVRTVVNQQINIPANGLVKLDIGKDNLGNQVFAGFNNLNVKADSAGDYRVYAKFEPVGQSIESSWEFRVG